MIIFLFESREDVKEIVLFIQHLTAVILLYTSFIKMYTFCQRCINQSYDNMHVFDDTLNQLHQTA